MSFLVDIDTHDGWRLDRTSDEGDGRVAVELADVAGSGDRIVLRGDLARLVDLLEDTLAELVDRKVRAQARPSAAPAQRTPDEMEVGGWVRVPGEARWRQVRQVTGQRSSGGLRSISFDGDGVYIAQAVETLPYLSEAEMALSEDEAA